MAKTAELKVRIEELEEELRRSKAREKELKAELIEARDLLDRQADTVQSVHDLHQGWIDALQMVQSEDGTWSMSLAFKDQIEAHSKLVARWNRLVDRWNREVAPQSVGRPLQASDAQVKEVKKLRKKVAEGRQLARANGKPTVLFLARTHLGAGGESARIALRECFGGPDFAALSGVVLADSWKLYVTSWHAGTNPDVPLTDKESQELDAWYGRK